MGVIYALTCALLWAFAVILLKRSGERVDPFSLNLFRVVISLPLLVITLLAAGLPLFPTASARDYLVLCASGVIGIAVADTLFHKSLNLVGAGVTAIVDTFYSPMVVLLAVLLIGERIGGRDLAGMLLIIGAVLVSTTVEPLEHRSRGDLLRGVAIGLLGIALLALGIVIAKPVLDRSPVLWVAVVRQAASAVVLVGAAVALPSRKRRLSVLRPSHAWGTMLPATVLGSYLALVFWIAGMKFALASIAAILTQSSSVFILLFSILFLREPFTRRKALSALLAVGGVLLVSLR